MANHQRNTAKEQFWRDALARCAASGLSVRAFCRRERLSEASLYAWRRTIGARDGKSAATARSGKAIAFVPAAVTDEPRRESAIVLEVVGGRRLRLPPSILPARLAELVQALEARGDR